MTTSCRRETLKTFRLLRPVLAVTAGCLLVPSCGAGDPLSSDSGTLDSALERPGQDGGGQPDAGGGSDAKGGSSGSGGAVGSGGSGSGGQVGSGGAPGTGGRAGSGGAPGTGGRLGSGGAVGSGGTIVGDCASIATTIPPASGSETRSSTTALPAGVHDFNNKRIGVQSTKSCDGEGQPTVFELADGATLKNVIIMGGMPGGNGVVCKGNCTLENVYWEDVCEDAATNSKDGSTMRIVSSIALNAADKVFQHNSKGGSKTVVANSYFKGLGKLWRSCGDCTNNGGPRHLEIDGAKVDGVTSCVAGANENFGDTVTIKNLCVKGGYDAGDDKPKICQVFRGVEKGDGSSEKLYGGASQWNTAVCKVSPSDVKAY